MYPIGTVMPVNITPLFPRKKNDIDVQTTMSHPPSGLLYFSNVLPPELHSSLLLRLKEDSEKHAETSWKTAGHRASRIVRHFGYNYPYTAKLELTLSDPIPDYIVPVIGLIRQQKGLENFAPDQAIVNRYLTGEGISKHVDHTRLFGDTVVSVTIGSGATMRFRKDDQTYDQWVAPRSIYAMTGESRYDWTHEMVKSRAQSGTRFSITFRQVNLEYLKKGQTPHDPIPLDSHATPPTGKVKVTVKPRTD